MFTDNRLLVSLGLIAGVLAACGGEQETTVERPRLVLAVKIGDPTALEAGWVPGRAKATRELNLSFRVSGRMIARPVDVGDQLNEGDLVAQLDPTDYKVELQNAQGNLDEAKAALKASQADLNRVLNIRKQDPGAISKTAIDRAVEERDSDQATIKALEAAVDDAQNRLERTTLTAPFDSTVVAKYVSIFEDVREKQPIVRLVDKSKIEFVVNLSERDIRFMPDLTNFRVQFDAFEGLEVPAEVKEVGTEASQTTRTYPVTLIMDQPEDKTILPGMAGRASADLKGDRTLLTVPLSAVFTEEAGSQEALQGQVDTSPPPAERPTYVWKVDEASGAVKRHEVVPHGVTAGGMQLKQGVEVGDWIVTAGVYSLVEGQKVRISQQRAE